MQKGTTIGQAITTVINGNRVLIYSWLNKYGKPGLFFYFPDKKNKSVIWYTSCAPFYMPPLDHLTKLPPELSDCNKSLVYTETFGVHMYFMTVDAKFWKIILNYGYVYFMFNRFSMNSSKFFKTLNAPMTFLVTDPKQEMVLHGIEHEPKDVFVAADASSDDSSPSETKEIQMVDILLQKVKDQKKQPSPVEEEQPSSVEEPMEIQQAPVQESIEIQQPPIEEPIETEKPPVEEPIVQEPMEIQQPAIEEPIKTEQAPIEEPIETEQPAIEEPIKTEQPPIEEPIVQESMETQQPPVEEPIETEQPAIEEPIVQESMETEQPPIEEPIVQESMEIEQPIIVPIENENQDPVDEYPIVLSNAVKKRSAPDSPQKKKKVQVLTREKHIDLEGETEIESESESENDCNCKSGCNSDCECKCGEHESKSDDYIDCDSDFESESDSPFRNVLLCPKNLRLLKKIPNSVVPHPSNEGFSQPSQEAKKIVKENLAILVKEFCDKKGLPRGYVYAYVLPYAYSTQATFFPIKLWFTYKNKHFYVCRWQTTKPDFQPISGTSIAELGRLAFSTRKTAEFKSNMRVRIGDNFVLPFSFLSHIWYLRDGKKGGRPLVQ